MRQKKCPQPMAITSEAGHSSTQMRQSLGVVVVWNCVTKCTMPATFFVFSGSLQKLSISFSLFHAK